MTLFNTHYSSTDCVRNKDLSDLFPFEKKEICKDIPKALTQFYLLLVAAKNTINSLDLEKGRFKELDPCVGENQCHVRAVIIALIAKLCLSSFSKIRDSIDQNLEAIEQYIKQVEEEIKHPKSKDFKTKISLPYSDVLKKFDIPSTEYELFLVQCYLLTAVIRKTNDELHPEKTDKKKLRDLVGTEFSKRINDKFLEPLVKNMRKNISELSVKFIRKVAFDTQDEHLIKMVSPSYSLPQIEHRPKSPHPDYLSCTPTFWTSELILKKGMLENLPIVLWHKQIDDKTNKEIRETCLYFQYDDQSGTYVPTNPKKFDGNKIVIVTEAKSRKKRDRLPFREITREELESTKFADWFYGNFAAHRQFFDASLDKAILQDVLEDDVRFQHYKELSEQGYSRDNPSKCHVWHMYCDLLRNTPFKQLTDNDLEAIYGDFYREHAMQELKRIEEELKLPLTIEVRGDKILVSLKNDIHDEALVKTNKELIEAIDHSVMLYKPNYTAKPWSETFELEKAWFMFSPLVLAIHHENPVKFLLDHRFYWTWGFNEIINFLSSKPELFEPAGFLDICADYLLNGRGYIGDLIAVVAAVGKALKIPNLKDRAFDLLVAAAMNYKSENLDSIITKNADHINLRQEAIKQLAPFKDEKPIREALEKMAKEEPVMQLKLDLETYLENRGSYFEALECEMMKRMMTIKFREEWGYEHLIDLGPSCHLWENPGLYKAILESGESTIAQEMMRQFTQENNAGPYSFLKFMALHTSDITLLSNIIDFLKENATVDKLSLIEKNHRNYFKLQSLDELLRDIEQDSILLQILDKNPREKKSQQPFSTHLIHINEWTHLKMLWRQQTLYSIITDEQLDLSLRIVAIRKCTEFFLKGQGEWRSEPSLDPQSEYKKSHKNYYHRGKVCTGLRVISVNGDLHTKVREEAKRILELIKNHLNDVVKGFRSPFDKITRELTPQTIRLLELLETPVKETGFYV